MNEVAATREEPTTPPPVRTVFYEFLKLGCTAFGGPAIIVHIRELAADSGCF